MADVIIKNRDGDDLTFTGVNAVKLNTTDGGTQIFSEGVAMDGVEIEVDFSAGDQNVIAADGYLVKSAVIKKPENLVPENIVDGVEIAGIVGTVKPGDYCITYMNDDGSETLYEKPIIHGDTAGDVIALGLLEQPTKETPDAEHTFSGWTDEIGGEVKTSMFENVTDNRTVYAAFLSVAIVASGECGESATWKLKGNGTLAISGEGFMTDYSSASAQPWYGYATDITSVVIEDGITGIGKNAFYNCTGLTSITIPSSVTSIGTNAFYNCTGLTSITIPSSVTSIGKNAFYNCTGLTSITIPSSVTSIGASAFYNCAGLTSLAVAAGNTVYHSSGNCIIETASKTLFAGCKESVIPTDGSVTSIGASAFACHTGLTSITIPSSVTSIGGTAFYKCTGLTSITIPSSVTSIGMGAFNGCTNLTSATFEATSGWTVEKFSSGTTSSISSSNLANSTTAATYLISTYSSGYTWSRS